MDVQGAPAAQHMMRVAFRADASVEMGTGHIMRCLTLADALRAHGAHCSFICREHPGNLIALIQQRGFAVHALAGVATHHPSATEPAHAAWLGADWRHDAQQCGAVMGADGVDWLIVDHYALDQNWERALRSQARRIMVVDDLADRPHDCDLLLDQNWFGELTALRYQERVPAECQCCLGPRYALLKPEYAQWRQQRERVDGAVRRVLVFLGGSDPSNQTLKALHALMQPDFAELAVDVVLGPNHPDVSGVKAAASIRANTIVHQALPSLAALMVSADLMIGAGGSTTWERMCLGLPALVVSIADNQTPINTALAHDGYIQYLGEMSQVTAETISDALCWSLRHPEALLRQSRMGQALVSGEGASALCQLLLQPRD